MKLQKLQKLRDSANGETCVRCESCDGTVILAHYFGVRRHAYGGGMGIKGHDLVAAFLCQKCHLEMDTLSKNKSERWLHSEEFLHYCALTWIRWIAKGTVKI